jgi:hypothetical protein
VDEDYLFLLYLSDRQVREFAQRGETLLARPGDDTAILCALRVLHAVDGTASGSRS